MDFLYFLSSLRASAPTDKKLIRRVLKADLEAVVVAATVTPFGALLAISRL